METDMTAREGMLKIIYESEDDALRFLRSPGPGDGNGLSAWTAVPLSEEMWREFGYRKPDDGMRVILRTFWRRTGLTAPWAGLEHRFFALTGVGVSEPLTPWIPGRLL